MITVKKINSKQSKQLRKFTILIYIVLICVGNQSAQHHCCSKGRYITLFYGWLGVPVFIIIFSLVFISIKILNTHVYAFSTIKKIQTNGFNFSWKWKKRDPICECLVLNYKKVLFSFPLVKLLQTKWILFDIKCIWFIFTENVQKKAM